MSRFVSKRCCLVAISIYHRSCTNNQYTRNHEQTLILKESEAEEIHIVPHKKYVQCDMFKYYFIQIQLWFYLQMLPRGACSYKNSSVAKTIACGQRCFIFCTISCGQNVLFKPKEDKTKGILNSQKSLHYYPKL